MEICKYAKRYEHMKKDLYLDAGELDFTVVDVNNDVKKLIGVSCNGFRAFAYFTDSYEQAKTSILMEYTASKWSKL